MKNWLGQCTNRPSLQNLSISEKLEREASHLSLLSPSWLILLVAVIKGSKSGGRGIFNWLPLFGVATIWGEWQQICHT
jgi:hypothetical protein